MAAVAKKAASPAVDHELEEARKQARSGAAIVRGRDGEILFRKRDYSQDLLHIPEHMRDRDYDLQWCRKEVLGKPDASNMQGHFETGWRPVPSSRYPGRFMPNGHEGAIELGDLILCERPMVLTQEARREQDFLARRQKDQQKEQFGLKELPKGFDEGERTVKRTLEGTPKDWLPSHTIEDGE